MTNPMDSIMTCERFADVLPALLDHEVDEATRVRAEAHAASCDACGALLADLRAIRTQAANLPELTPSRDLWSGIAARIETPVVEIVPGRGAANRAADDSSTRQTRIVANRTPAAPTRSRRWQTSVWAGAAAAGIVAVTAAVTHELTKRTIVVPTPSAPAMIAIAPTTTRDSTTPATTTDSALPSGASSNITTPPAAPSTGTLVANTTSAEKTYEGEIERLRAIVTAHRSSLDSTTIRVIEQNLRVIDEAIAQCRAALERDPGSRFLLESLNNALDTKVQLLRTAAMLSSRT